MCSSWKEMGNSSADLRLRARQTLSTNQISEGRLGRYGCLICSNRKEMERPTRLLVPNGLNQYFPAKRVVVLRLSIICGSRKEMVRPNRPSAFNFPGVLFHAAGMISPYRSLSCGSREEIVRREQLLIASNTANKLLMQACLPHLLGHEGVLARQKTFIHVTAARP